MGRRRTAPADSGIHLSWPGRPTDGLAAPPAAAARLTVGDRFPGDPGAAGADATLVEGDAVPTLDAWRSGAVPASVERPRLIYLDPPFATGATFASLIPIGNRRAGQPTLRLPAYRDAWPDGLAGYLTFMAGLLARLHDLLPADGWLCLHCDHRASAQLRLILDEIFGAGAFRNEIVWSYGLGNGTSPRGFPRKHDTLLLYARSEAATFHPVRGEVSPAMLAKYRHVRPDGTRFMRSYGREYDLRGGKPVGSVWEIPSIAPTSGERSGYPTQKPLALLDRLISATTRPGDTVLDPCCGSGTTLVAATTSGRRAVGLDDSPLAIAAARARVVMAGAPLTVLRASTPPSRSGDERAEDGAASSGLPTGGHPGGPARRYAVSVTLERGSADRSPRDAIVHLGAPTVEGARGDGPPIGRFRIVEGTLVESARGGGSRVVIASGWDWIEGWAVRVGPVGGERADEPLDWQAAAFRAGRDRTLPDRLAVELPPGQGPLSATVRLWDVFGARSDHALTLVAPSP